MKIWSCRNQPIRSEYYFASTNQQRVFTCRKAVLLLHEVTHWKVSIRCASLRQEDWVVETKELVSSNQKLVIFVSTNQQQVLPPILWRLSKRNSYLSGKPILGWIRSKMREQDMMAPPFSIALWGLSRVKICLLFSHLFFINTFPVQTYLVEVPPTGLIPNVLMYSLVTKMLETDSVGEGFTCQPIRC